MCNINGLKDHSTRHQMDVSDQCKTYRKSQELPLGTFAFRILLKRRGLSLSEFGVRMSQLSPGLLMSVHRTIQTYGPRTGNIRPSDGCRTRAAAPSARRGPSPSGIPPCWRGPRVRRSSASAKNRILAFRLRSSPNTVHFTI